MQAEKLKTVDAETLLASGCDVEYQELTLQFHDLVWELVERKNSEEIHKSEIPQFLFRVVKFMKNRTEWHGTATELIADMAEVKTTPNVVTKFSQSFSFSSGVTLTLIPCVLLLIKSNPFSFL